jgi:hypothetical protein
MAYKEPNQNIRNGLWDGGNPESVLPDHKTRTAETALAVGIVRSTGKETSARKSDNPLSSPEMRIGRAEVAGARTLE